jgi:hypothetical protein
VQYLDHEALMKKEAEEKEEARKATAAASMANAEAAEDTRNAESIRNALEAVPPDPHCGLLLVDIGPLSAAKTSPYHEN